MKNRSNMAPVENYKGVSVPLETNAGIRASTLDAAAMSSRMSGNRRQQGLCGDALQAVVNLLYRP
jgi:hypothetical protein